MNIIGINEINSEREWEEGGLELEGTESIIGLFI